MARKPMHPGSIFIRKGYSSRLYIKYRSRTIATGLKDSNPNRRIAEGMLWILWRRDKGLPDIDGAQAVAVTQHHQTAGAISTGEVYVDDGGLYAIEHAREQFGVWMTATKKAPKTIEAYTNAIKKLDPLGLSAAAFERAAEKFVLTTRLGPASQNIVLRNFRVFARYCQKRGWTDRDADVMQYQVKGVRKAVVVLTEQEWKDALAGIRENRGGDVFALFLEFLMATGLRIKEGLTVKRNQIVTIDGVQLLHLKNKIDAQGEYIPLSKRAVAIASDRLRITRNEDDCIWPWRATSTSSLNRQFNRALVAVGVDTSKRSGFHIIRKTFRHRLKQAGTSLGDSKALMRHRDIRVTENYYTYYDTIELKTALDAAEDWVKN